MKSSLHYWCKMRRVFITVLLAYGIPLGRFHKGPKTLAPIVHTKSLGIWAERESYLMPCG